MTGSIEGPIAALVAQLIWQTPPSTFQEARREEQDAFYRLMIIINKYCDHRPVIEECWCNNESDQQVRGISTHKMYST